LETNESDKEQRGEARAADMSTHTHEHKLSDRHVDSHTWTQTVGPTVSSTQKCKYINIHSKPQLQCKWTKPQCSTYSQL